MAKESTRTAKSQSRAFVAAAKAAGCDESKAAFEAKLAAIAKAPVAAPHRVDKVTAQRRPKGAA